MIEGRKILIVEHERSEQRPGKTEERQSTFR